MQWGVRRRPFSPASRRPGSPVPAGLRRAQGSGAKAMVKERVNRRQERRPAGRVMYGPPRVCKGRVEGGQGVGCRHVSGLGWGAWSSRALMGSAHTGLIISLHAGWTSGAGQAESLLSTHSCRLDPPIAASPAPMKASGTQREMTLARRSSRPARRPARPRPRNEVGRRRQISAVADTRGQLDRSLRLPRLRRWKQRQAPVDSGRIHRERPALEAEVTIRRRSPAVPRPGSGQLLVERAGFRRSASLHLRARRAGTALRRAGPLRVHGPGVRRGGCGSRA